MSDNFKPNIIGFLCNWCSYAAADLAGNNKLDVPGNLTTIRVMCSSRVDPVSILSAYLRGGDGILIAGCHPGDCHYQTGNYYARRRYALLHKILDTFKLDPERFQLSWISASEGKRFSEVTSKFAKKIEELGPNVLKNNPFID
jgi:F420-non-reducing hydrogenase iron-sulfur subunit